MTSTVLSNCNEALLFFPKKSCSGKWGSNLENIIPKIVKQDFFGGLDGFPNFLVSLSNHAGFDISR